MIFKKEQGDLPPPPLVARLDVEGFSSLLE